MTSPWISRDCVTIAKPGLNAKNLTYTRYNLEGVKRAEDAGMDEVEALLFTAVEGTGVPV